MARIISCSFQWFTCTDLFHLVALSTFQYGRYTSEYTVSTEWNFIDTKPTVSSKTSGFYNSIKLSPTYLILSAKLNKYLNKRSRTLREHLTTEHIVIIFIIFYTTLWLYCYVHSNFYNEQNSFHAHLHTTLIPYIWYLFLHSTLLLSIFIHF